MTGLRAHASEGTTSLRHVLIHAARRPKTAHNEPLGEAVHWTVEADDYETGKAQIDAAVPEDWVLLGVRVER